MSKVSESWFEKAAEMMVRQNMSLRQATMELGIDLTSADCEKIQRRKDFQKVLWAERNKFHTEIANTPGRTKTAAVGLMALLIQKLIEEGEWDKALEGIQKLAKIEGWDKSQEINIFAGITAKDLSEARAELLKLAKERTPNTANPETLPN